MNNNFSNISEVNMKKISSSLADIDSMSTCTSANILVASITFRLGKYWY